MRINCLTYAGTHTSFFTTPEWGWPANCGGLPAEGVNPRVAPPGAGKTAKGSWSPKHRDFIRTTVLTANSPPHRGGSSCNCGLIRAIFFCKKKFYPAGWPGMPEKFACYCSQRLVRSFFISLRVYPKQSCHLSC